MNVLFLVGSVLAVGALLLATIVSLFAAAKGRALFFALSAGAWALLYGGALLVASARSRDVLLAPGEIKRFCGFFLDCHVGVALAGHTTRAQDDGRVRHTFTLRFSSNAVRETMRPWRVQLVLEDESGRRYTRGDRVTDGASAPLEQDVAPGRSYDVQVSINLPANAKPRRMLVRQGPAVLFPEAILIDDEASPLHGKTWLAVPGA